MSAEPMETVKSGKRTIKEEPGTGGGTAIEVTTEGLRPPRLFKHTVERRDIIIWCLKSYDDYVGRMKVANEDGGERSLVSMRELVASTVLSVLALKYYPTKVRHGAHGGGGTNEVGENGRIGRRGVG